MMGKPRFEYFTEHGSTSPEVRSEDRRPVQIYDVTLRDGEQQAGVIFSVEQKVGVFKALDRAGVPVIETGMVAASDEEIRVAQTVMAGPHQARVFLLSRAMKEDVDRVHQAGVDGITIETIANAEVAARVFGWGPNDAVDRARAAIHRAKEHGLEVNLFLVDATRVGAARLGELAAEICADAGPDTITVADTFGVANPGAIASYVAALDTATGLPIYVHCHNEYGLAVANTCSGLEAGAFGAHVSVNGMGERAGNAALEEVVMAGLGPYAWSTDVDLKSLTRLSKLVADITGVHPAPNKAVVGGALFKLESGVAAAFYEALEDGGQGGDDLRHRARKARHVEHARLMLGHHAMRRNAGRAGDSMRPFALIPGQHPHLEAIGDELRTEVPHHRPYEQLPPSPVAVMVGERRGVGCLPHFIAV